jgi:hypothetical protein
LGKELLFGEANEHKYNCRQNAECFNVTVNCVQGAVLQGVKAIPEPLIFEDGTGTLSQNVGNHLPTYAAQHPSRAKTIPSLLTYRHTLTGFPL